MIGQGRWKEQSVSADEYLDKLFADDPICPGCGEGRNEHVVMLTHQSFYVRCVNVRGIDQ